MAHAHHASNAPFRSPVGLRNAILAAAAIHVLLNAVLATQILHILDLFGQVGSHGLSDVLRADLQQSGRRQIALSGLQALVILVACILGGCWIHRAARNVRALGARDLSDSPAWAVGWYFVPFANLVRPFRAMQEIWRASLSPARWQRLNTHPLLGAWWVVLVAMGLYGTFAAANQSVEGTVYALHAKELMVLWLQPLSAAAMLLFAAVVRRITRMQLDERARQFSAPAPIGVMPALA